jgi:hypothetical protein
MEGLAMRRLTLFTVLIVSLAAVSAAAATGPPNRFTTPDQTTTLNVCDFDVTVTIHQENAVMFFYDADGDLTMLLNHVTEQDTFSANGKTLVGDPYVYNFQVLFDANGDVTHIYASGIAEKLVFPNGTVFLSAGRIDWVTHDVSFLLAPDVGVSGDVDAFCAYFTA